MNPIDVVLDALKKGYKTTEFWLSFLAAAFAGVLAIWDPNKGWKDQVTAIAIAVVAAAYSISRSHLKGKRVTALAIAGTAPAASSNENVIDDYEGEGGVGDVTP